MDVIGNRVKNVRQKLGYSLTDLSTKSGVSRGYIHLLESGKQTNPTMDVVRNIASAMNIPAMQLWSADGEDVQMSVTDDECFLVELFRSGDYAGILEFIAAKLRG